ncbi:putative peptidoglycan lipid II flippase [Bhargavaea ginsengi]|uniref:Putative peptidoglycan lipid II flippase n=1 Tax=Bhargavaea ginsengi TaxID=426757 RepID=A0A1H7ADK9_9BACL|nr:murein biosynthesis integral membrane protein MurJ [Bhargavaea ginsengi]SEJ62634.1 putative peptidoglycan lipid II flippase [Bhargavaea ginsengi]
MNRILKIIGAVAVINIVARLFGFAREVLIGHQFGTGAIADSIITAYTVPNFIYLIAGGALTTAFISVYHRSEQEKGSLVRETFTGISVFILLVTALLTVFAGPVLRLLFGGMEEEGYALAHELYLWMMPSAFFLVLSTWLSGLLNVNDRFQMSSFAVLLYNFLFFAIPFAFTGVFGAESYGYGALIAAVLMAGFLFWGVSRLKMYSFRVKWPLGGSQGALWKMALPIMLGGATLQFYFLIHRIYSAGLGEGTVSAVNYASKLTQFPQAILMTAVTTVIYPLLSRKMGEGDHAAVSSVYRKGIRALTLLVIPAAIFIWFFAEPMTRLVFGHGSFTEESLALTAPYVQLFGLSIFFISLNTYITRFYYAAGNSLIPVLFSVLGVFLVNIAVIRLTIGEIGGAAIAWGTIAGSALNAGLLMGYAAGKLNLSVKEGNGAGWKLPIILLLLIPSAAMIRWLSDEATGGAFSEAAGGALIFGLIYLVLLIVFRLPESKQLILMLKRK